jgi:hypothetical protein
MGCQNLHRCGSHGQVQPNAFLSTNDGVMFAARVTSSGLRVKSLAHATNPSGPTSSALSPRRSLASLARYPTWSPQKPSSDCSDAGRPKSKSKPFPFRSSVPSLVPSPSWKSGHLRPTNGFIAEVVAEGRPPDTFSEVPRCLRFAAPIAGSHWDPPGVEHRITLAGRVEG